MDTPTPVSISILVIADFILQLLLLLLLLLCYCCATGTTTTTTTTTAAVAATTTIAAAAAATITTTTTIVKYHYLLVGFNLLFVNNAAFLEYVFVLVACNTYFCKPNQHTFRKQYYYCYAHTAVLYTFAWVFIISHFLSCHQSVKPTIFRFLYIHLCTLIYLHASLG